MSDSSDNEDMGLNEEQSSEEAEDQSDEEVAEDDNGADINASATESDENDDDDEVDDDKDVPKSKKEPKPYTASASKVAKVTEKIMQNHEKRKGKQLYIRFPEKLPSSIEEFREKVKALSSLIIDSHKPRQKHARFCLVDFATTEDRDKTLKELSKKDSKIFVSIPKTDDENFVKTMIDKKIKAIEKKRVKNLVRLQTKDQVKEKKFTSILSVLNIPGNTSIAEIRELFPDAVDIQTRGTTGEHAGKLIATVTLPSTNDAKLNSRRKLKLGENKLIIRFKNKRLIKKKGKKNLNAQAGLGPKKKGPIPPPKADAKKPNAKSPKKRPNSENGNSEVVQKKSKKEKKAKGESEKPVPAKKNPNANKPEKKDGKPNNKQNNNKKVQKNQKKQQPKKKGKGVAAAAEE